MPEQEFVRTKKVRLHATLSKMANQPGANIGSDIIDKLCKYFGCQTGDLLVYVPD